VLIDVETAATVQVRSSTRWRLLRSLPEARWAALSTTLFGVGGVAHLVGAPPAVYWVLYLACYVSGGWCA
jgi:hypothetical protein